MAAEYLLDVLGDKPVLSLPTQRRAPQRPPSTTLPDPAAGRTATMKGTSSRRRQERRTAVEQDKDGALPGDVRRRLSSVLAREFSKKVNFP